MSPDPILSARGLTYRYPEASAPALRDVTLDIEPGSFTVVAGESGGGKSTLLRAACGLVPHFHGGEVSGELVVGGMSVRDHGPGELAAICGTVFQDPESQVVMSGVRAEVSLPLEHRGSAPGAVARAVEEVALVLGIAGLLDRQVETLSGGELQRVALAAALAHRPRLLVLDEPTSQLDPVAGDELVWLLRRLNEEWGTAVLMAEHRLERCLPAADRVIAVEGGSVVHDSAPRDFLAWAAATKPALATPGARLFSLAGLSPLPGSVKEARRQLAAAGLMPRDDEAEDLSGAERSARRSLRRARRPSAAVEARGVWHELRDGPAILSGVELRVDPGERVALMGRNGAGKSTLLRNLKGLSTPTRGRIERGGDVALLMQNPGDYLVHEHVRDEASAAAVDAAGLSTRADSNPRDLSGGERQRLALELVLDADDIGLVCLDEPTRGMDRARKLALARRLERLAAAGTAVLVATHDTEFAAEFAERVVLMGPGVVIADGPAAEVLAGGWHFATETARVLGGAGGALTPEQGARLLGRELVSR
ncbi:MAG: energy-coupling factor transport system ATP-binding protein [Thermoleophilaceae bacterium]|nr:energy-coupling factor transport system ATP-binding protein [Thermoleophilaceae bacterium]